MSKGKKFIVEGLILIAIGYLITKLSLFNINIADFLKGFLEGFTMSLGVVFILLGIYCETPSFQTIKNYKSKLLKKLTK